MEKIIVVFKDGNRKTPYLEWLFGLKDKTVRSRIVSRIDRVRYNNYGDHRRLRSIIELRLHFGKGYRVYFGEDGDDIVLLLIGGDKGSQDKDIQKALGYWEDYNEKK